MPAKLFVISVRSLVESMLVSGDISTGFSGSIRLNQRALEGTRLHQKLQKMEKGDYVKEVPMSETRKVFLSDGTHAADLMVEGRADGIFTMDTMRVLERTLETGLSEEEGLEEGLRVIDEIKSVDLDLAYIDHDTYPLHFAQARIYAYFLSNLEDLDRVGIRISYVHTETEEIKHLYEVKTREELADFYFHVTDLYAAWIRFKVEWDEVRDESIRRMNFPFESFRSGQRAMSAYVYRTIEEKSKIFLQAPTGIGKTMSALFPAIKSIGEGKLEKTFYLTAKNVTGEACERAADLLYESQKMKLKTLRITARDRICFLEKRSCRAQDCPYAKGHYDRVNEAALTALQTYDLFDMDTIRKIAKENQVCPYELSLDIASWCDLIICDYNYAFDPSVCLKRFFTVGKQDFALLIDESHNLPDRARNMFSAEITKKEILALKKMKQEKPVKGKTTALGRAINRVNKLFLEAAKEAGEAKLCRAVDVTGSEKVNNEWLRAVDLLSEKLGAEIEKAAKAGREVEEEFFETYFRLLFFVRCAQEEAKGYECYFEFTGGDVFFRQFCVDPSEHLKKTYDNVRSVIFFSATLMPVNYYRKLLGAKEEEDAIALPNPFDISRRLLMTCPVGVTYKTRDRNIPYICEMIHRSTQVKKGHYMVFFPSFAFMEKAAEHFRSRYPDRNLKVQERAMTEEERNEFLKDFREDQEEILGFCVIGGVFSEGIDLKGDALIGVVIVSVGLPQISPERDLIRDYFDREEDSGFEYAYVYPGIGKVFQAAGRVIRSEKDRGFILLMDDRFESYRYRELFPSDWEEIRSTNTDNIEEIVSDFFEMTEE